MSKRQEFKKFVENYYTGNMKLKGNVVGPPARQKIHRLLARESIVPANIVSFATLVYNISQKPNLQPLQLSVADDNVLFGTKQAGQTLSYRIDSGDSRFDRLVKNVRKMKYEENIDTTVVNWILSSEDFRLESMKPFGLYLGVVFMNMIPNDISAVDDVSPGPSNPLESPGPSNPWESPSFNSWDDENDDGNDDENDDGNDDGYGWHGDDDGEDDGGWRDDDEDEDDY
jgi:hypothetical protein